MAGRGRPRKYTPERLEKAVERYFLSISRRVEVTEQIDTGRRDSMGHAIYRQEPVENALGERVYRMEYFFPPSMRGLYEALGIDKSTWAVYADHGKHPELAHITDGVYERMKAWNENELLTRAGVPVYPTPSERTPEYYAKRPCERLIASAAALLDEALGERTRTTPS